MLSVVDYMDTYFVTSDAMIYQMVNQMVTQSRYRYMSFIIRKPWHSRFFSVYNLCFEKLLFFHYRAGRREG